MEMLSGVVKRGFTDVQRPEDYTPPDVEFVYDSATNNFYPKDETPEDLGGVALRYAA